MHTILFIIVILLSAFALLWIWSIYIRQINKRKAKIQVKHSSLYSNTDTVPRKTSQLRAIRDRFNTNKKSINNKNNLLFPHGLNWYQNEDRIDRDHLVELYGEDNYLRALSGELWLGMPYDLCVGAIMDKESIARYLVPLEHTAGKLKVATNCWFYDSEEMGHPSKPSGGCLFVIVDEQFTVQGWDLGNTQSNNLNEIDPNY